jgi:siroheme synthase
LKGGDPFVFGRGGEEAEFLARHHIPFEVVPGVSSAHAVPAYAGIPVTHRNLASSFAVVTGHKAIKSRTPSIDWKKLSQGVDTLLIMMGLTNLPNIIAQLKKDRPSSTPVAVITHGTTGHQRCVTGMLKNILAKVRAEKLEPPAIIIVGDVVRLREDLRWFEKE